MHCINRPLPHRRFSVFNCLLAAMGALAGANHLAASQDAVTAAHELGLTPQSMVAAGITDQATANGILANIVEAGAQIESLQLARNQLDAASAEMTELQQLVLAHPDNEAFAAAYQTAAAQLDEAKAQVQSVTDDLLSTALQEVPAQHHNVLEAWRDSRTRDVPPSYRAVARGDGEWKQIQSALRANQRAQQLGEPVPPDAAAVINNVESEYEVVEAQFNLDTHLESIESVFDNFM